MMIIDLYDVLCQMIMASEMNLFAKSAESCLCVLVALLHLSQACGNKREEYVAGSQDR